MQRGESSCSEENPHAARRIIIQRLKEAASARSVLRRFGQPHESLTGSIRETLQASSRFLGIRTGLLSVPEFL